MSTQVSTKNQIVAGQNGLRASPADMFQTPSSSKRTMRMFLTFRFFGVDPKTGGVGGALVPSPTKATTQTSKRHLGQGVE
ncbi:hypothetical protein UPIE_35 [Mycobacterium phage UPIE]|uniref:Uncharacterized protein n=1 Tax=Mycobacterium phage UPIE TaxID=1034147 RepID=G1BRW1_9CAUD|nr:hypothetical protein UPIE_35 [Mycobacterium phage UPIE]